MRAVYTMAFQTLALDMSRYPLPLQPFIGGSFTSSKGGKQTLKSAVNDAVVTEGTYISSSTAC